MGNFDYDAAMGPEGMDPLSCGDSDSLVLSVLCGSKPRDEFYLETI
jgi:hypothetical protein